MKKNIIKAGKPELLAPAGNLEKMKVAFAYGADAVYAGIPDFSMRVRINIFDMAGLKEGIEYAHKLSKKFYVTVNIIAHNKHLDRLPAHIKELKKMKPDALIVSDPGVKAEIIKIWPKAVFHLSTQANCTNKEAAKFWHKQGFERVILGREVTIEEIREIRRYAPKLELETFVHGAMCMAYSGRCFLSKYLTNRSANLGDCVQACRWPYRGPMRTERGIMRTDKNIPLLTKEGQGEVSRRDLQTTTPHPNPLLIKERETFIQPEGREEVFELVEEEHGSYILNSEDMCLIKRAPEMIEAGISSFKIEGRAKSVYYLAQVIWAYRKAIDIAFNPPTPLIKGVGKKVPLTRGIKGVNKELNYLFKELEEKLMHRGYTEGFMFGNGKMAQNLENSHNKSEWEFCGVVMSRTNADNNIPLLTKEGAGEVLGRAAQTTPPHPNPLPEMLSLQAGLLGKERGNFVKVHNTLKIGDTIEILSPFKDVVRLKLRNMYSAETGEKITEAHGGQKKTVLIKSKEEWPEFSVIRRKIV